jgi:serine/threonine protein kinase
MDLPEDARGAWLEGLLEPFPGAKVLLAKMLAEDASGAGDPLLDTLPKISADTAAHSAERSGLQAGNRIGIYALVRETGQGGMATVWLARRTDELIQRPVALKLPHLHLQSARFAERFARERDILANLTHPHIAHLYDAGISPEGQPFLAMEFVAGETIIEYCAKQELGLDERLQLFLQVLAAVEYAHTQGVIHRDLKPSNILVREAGQVVLLDFGIAKLIVAGQAEQTELTLHGGAALTPHYASPEQIRGETLGPTTDVYSLGVLLYELLSGQRPYELTGSTRGALEQAILSTEPRRPSEVVTQKPRTGDTGSSPQTPRSRLRGDLDTIVLKALKKTPTERYPTAGAFAADLQHYLRHEAVTARPDTITYRLRKLAHRHRSALQVAGLAGLAGAAIAIIAAFNGGWLSNHHASAILPAAPPTTSADKIDPKSVAVLPFVDMSEKKDQEYFSDGLAEELIDHLAHTPDLMVIARTSSFQFKGKNEDVRTIGQKLRVANLLEGSVRKSGETLRVTAQLIRGSDGSHLWSETYDRNEGDIFKVQDSIAAAVVAALQAAMGKFASSTQNANIEAYSAFLRGQFLRRRRTREDSDRALAAYQESARLAPRYAVAWVGIADAYSDRGIEGWMMPRRAYAEARKAIDHALSIDPSLAIAHRTIADLDWNYLFDFGAARTEMTRTRELDPIEAARDGMSGWDLLISGKLDEGIRYFQEEMKSDPLNTSRLYDLSFALQSGERWAEAESAARLLLELNPSFSQAHCNLGEVLLDEHMPAEALVIMSKEADAEMRWCTADALWVLGRHAEADAQLSAATAQYANTQAFDFAESYARRNDKEQAFKWLNRAYENRDPGITLISIDPMLRNLRGDPRYTALLRKLKLPQ